MNSHSLTTRGVALIGLVGVLTVMAAFAAENTTAAGFLVKPARLIVLSDIEADPDDTQSFIRLLLYSNGIDLQGLVATTSTWKRTSVAPESIRAVINAYGKVHANLLKHDVRYPSPGSLEALVKAGRPAYGMSAVGDGMDSEGSDWIIRVLEQKDDRPLWVAAWGGVNTLAQSLHKLRATCAPAEVDRLVAKLRVYTISDQDDSGPWLRKHFPNLFYIVTPGGDYACSVWVGINAVVDGIDNATISNRWLATHIQQGHGPLGAAYPDVAWGMEGDTPSFLGLIPNGLNEPEHPDWGGWGGRHRFYRPDVPVTDPKTFIGKVPIETETRPIWTNTIDEYTPPVHGEYGRSIKAGEKSFKGAQVTLWRWRDDVQNDFAARMDWTTRSYADANHPPVPVLSHPNAISVHSGESFGLDAHESYDPDGDSLSFYWSAYREVGSAKEPVIINGAENAVGAWATAPQVDRQETVHIILALTDKGSPALTRYQRVVVTVTP